MKIIYQCLSVLAASLCLVACTMTEQGEGKPYEELPPLTQESTWAFFRALPVDALPAQVATVEQRQAYMVGYLAMMEENAADFDYDEDYNPDDPANLSTITWSEAFLSEEAAFDSEHGGPTEYATLLIYPGLDPDKLFGILQRGSFTGEGSTTLPEKYYWYSIGKNKVSQVAQLPMNKPYTEDDLTADPLLSYGAEGLYYAIKQKQYDQVYMPKQMQVYINSVGLTDVVYDWKGVGFVRDETYKSPVIYNYAFANIPLGGKVPWNINGFTTSYVDSEGGPRYDITKDGESEPTLSVMANQYDGMKIWGIFVYSDRYCNYNGIYPGMKANEAIGKLQETNRRYYGENCPPTVSPHYYDVDGKEYAAIFSGFEDNFIYIVDKDKYLENNKFTDDATILAIEIVNGVG